MAKLLQSKEGGTWSSHPQVAVFNDASVINAVSASGEGVVVVVGSMFGIEETNMAISLDFGENWAEIVNDGALYPFLASPLTGVFLKNDYEWVIRNAAGEVWYCTDGGFTWSDVTYPSELTLAEFTSGMRFFNDHWWFYGQGSGNGDWDTPLIKSTDLLNWDPVVTCWSGTYPPQEDYIGAPHDSDSGTIDNLRTDVLTNTILVNGSSTVTGSKVMLSPDGGGNWMEIGYKADDTFREDEGYSGIYKWPDEWVFDSKGGMTYAYGSWFIANGYGVPAEFNMPMIRLSPDGQVSEPVILPQQIEMYGLVLMSGGDIT